MKNLLIIGAGGMGREIFNLAKECTGFNNEYSIKGFLDDNPESLAKFDSFYPPIISSISDYNITDDDVFVCSLGNVNLKKKCIEIILNKGGKFISLIHPKAIIYETSVIGEGCIVFPYAIVGSDTKIGNYVLLQSFCSIAHDVIIGNFSRIDVQTLCVGGVKIGDCVTLHSSSIINHNVTVESYSVVGAQSFVIKNVKKGTTVHGNPAIRLK